MWGWPRKNKPFISPVLVIDALGFSARIKSCDIEGLSHIGQRLDRHYHQFRASIPFGVVVTTPNRVYGTSEFSTFRLNDMFILFSDRARDYGDAIHRHLVATSVLFHSLLIDGFIPRGGLGFGPVLRSKDSILGGGFIDAYEASEKRSAILKNVCGVQLSLNFLMRLPRSTMTYKLISYYEGAFFLNPLVLVDPDLGPFNSERLLKLLEVAGANREKLDGTARFLSDSEDFDAARLPNSRSWNFARLLAHTSRCGQVMQAHCGGEE